jgi:hypothetical protein
MESSNQNVRRQRVGGAAALYLALAYLAAMPYFLLVVDYQGATTAAEKVALVLGNYASMYAMHFATYMLFGVALAVLALALYDRLKAHAPLTARVATVVGLFWAFALLASGMVFTYGMTTIAALAKTDLAQAELAWLTIEPVSQALGGAGGELLGGLWVLLVSWVALRGSALPKVLGWLGVVVGGAGLVSVVPPLHDAAYAFGLLQIVWFVWLGVVLMTTTAPASEPGGVSQKRAAQAERTDPAPRPITGDAGLA